MLASQSRLREHLGDAYAWLARQLLPVSLYDYQCGAKAIDAAAWRTVREDVYEPGFGWDVEFLAAAARRDCAVAEVPIAWVDQPNSTVRPLRAAPSLCRGLVRGRRGRTPDHPRTLPLSRRLADRE